MVWILSWVVLLGIVAFVVIAIIPIPFVSVVGMAIDQNSFTRDAPFIEHSPCYLECQGQKS